MRVYSLLYALTVNYSSDVVPVMIIQVMSKSDASIKCYNLLHNIHNILNISLVLDIKIIIIGDSS